MPVSLKSVLVGATLGFAGATLGFPGTSFIVGVSNSASRCDMMEKDVLTIADSHLWTTDYKPGAKDGNDIKRHFPSLCRPNKDDMLTFGIVVNVDSTGSAWKSHIGILDEGCNLLSAFDFPNNNDGCGSWIIPADDYLERELRVININRPSGNGQWMAKNMEIEFRYGKGRYLDTEDGHCACHKHLTEFHGDFLEPEESESIKQQWHCRCSFAKSGDGSFTPQGVELNL